VKIPHVSNLWLPHRLVGRIGRVSQLSPQWVRRAAAAVTLTLVLAAGVASFAVLVQRWDMLSGAPPAPPVDPGRVIDFRGQDSQSWAEYWLIVGQAAGVG
jgi:hypothetical protein